MSARAAGFFDLDRTVIRRSSALALAGAFRRRGLIGRRHLVKAAIWQLLFAARGASGETIRRGIDDGLAVLRGLPQDELQELVADAMRPSLLPLVYADAAALVEQHRARGEPTYLVSATLHEIVEAIAGELGVDRAIGSVCEVEDGVFTGRVLRSVYGERKADAVREAAARDGVDLAAATAYSDSHTDLPLLEAVGRPVAVNPDRELLRVATARSWPILRFRTPLAVPDVA